MRKLNKKGFTLVELLAVIVILAIIILLAMPNIISSMNNARRGAFATEVNSIIRQAGTAYSELSMQGNLPSGSTVCFDVKMLGNQTGGKGYLSKNLSNYSGTITMTISGSAVAYDVKITDGTYKIDGTGTDFANSAVADASGILTDCVGLGKPKPTGW